VGRKAFSLIELTVVLAILAIAAAVAAFKVAGPMHSAQTRDVIDQVVRLDHLARAHAREHDQPARIVVGAADRQLRRTAAAGDRTIGTPLELPAGFLITDCLIGGQSVSGGSASVSVSAAGLTPSYALLLEGPGGRKQWVLLAGLTGEAMELDDGNEVREILQAAGGGDDPD